MTDDLRAVAQEFIDYYTGPAKHARNGCSNCGGTPHSSTCFVGRFQTALEAVAPVIERRVKERAK